MPLPMVHFQAAYKIEEQFNVKNRAEYYLGSISPDAVHMRSDFKREIKGTSHLWDADKAKHRENVRKFLHENSGGLNADYFKGYCVHILTDICWEGSVYALYKSRFSEDKNPLQDERWAYFNDTDQLDFLLHMEWIHTPEIWDLLKGINISLADTFVSDKEVNAWNERTLHWYDSGESQHKNPIKYITIRDIENFIMETDFTI
ncbi:MAG: hypothetical protein AB9835_06460 [Eubacteriales bacterium]